MSIIDNYDEHIERLEAEKAKLIAERDDYRENHLDLLTDVLDAKNIMLDAGVKQDQFIAMFKEYAMGYKNLLAEREAARLLM